MRVISRAAVLALAHEAAHEAPHVEPHDGQVPAHTDGFSDEALRRAPHRLDPVGPGLVAERQLGFPQPGLEVVVAPDVLEPVGRGDHLQDVGLVDDLGFLRGDQRRVELPPGHERQREDVLRLVVREARERPRDHLALAVREVDRYLLRLGVGAREGAGDELLEDRAVGQRKIEDMQSRGKMGRQYETGAREQDRVQTGPEQGIAVPQPADDAGVLEKRVEIQ